MVNSTVVQYLKEKKQDVSCDDNLLYFSLKALCFAGLFPYEKVYTKEAEAVSCIPDHFILPLLSNIVFTNCEILFDI
jgi:hypothetical protein